MMSNFRDNVVWISAGIFRCGVEWTKNQPTRHHENSLYFSFEPFLSHLLVHYLIIVMHTSTVHKCNNQLHLRHPSPRASMIFHKGRSYGSVVPGKNEILLIELIRQNSKITVKEIADTLKLSKRQCERIIADLKHRGILSRKGTNRTGYWTIAGL